MTQTIQRVELNTYYDSPVHCPFCGTAIAEADTPYDPNVHVCPHLLFVAHDEGFEYRSERFDENLGIAGVEDDDVWDHYEAKGIEIGNGYDGLTDRVTLPDAIKIATYVSAPSFFGAYYGFAPVNQE